MTACTIVIPTHNREDLLPRAVQSALAACPPDGQVLVVDDKSLVAATQTLAAVSDARLTVVSNTGPSGAAHTRNLGAQSALGEVIFFLDDDDQLLPGHCAQVLDSLAAEGAGCDWGFCSTWVQHPDTRTLNARKRLQSGPVPMNAAPRDLVAAMSDGFWIRRQVFLKVGGLDPDQTIDEDTDLCVRLWAQGHRPWYGAQPGAVVYRGYAPLHAQGAPLTQATSGAKGVQCYLRTHDRNAPHVSASRRMRWFLASRYVRRAVNTGQHRNAWVFACQQRPLLLACALGVLVCAKWLGRELRRARAS